MNSTLATTWSPPVTPALGGCPTATVALHDWPMQVPCVVHGFVRSTEPDNLRTQRRLAELGFLPGERVCIVARGWLRRSPIAVRVGQSTFALRAHEAALVHVHAVGATR